MNTAQVFQVVNSLTAPVWLLWMFAPKSRPSRALANSLWPWVLLALVYITLFIIAVAVQGSFSLAEFTSLAGVQGLFARDWSAMAGWLHILAFDLFVGRWIMRQAPEGGYKLLPCLFGVWMFGPAGLLLFLLLRRWITGGPGEELPT